MLLYGFCVLVRFSPAALFSPQSLLSEGLVAQKGTLRQQYVTEKYKPEALGGKEISITIHN
jgi:hypothetical protein